MRVAVWAMTIGSLALAACSQSDKTDPTPDKPDVSDVFADPCSEQPNLLLREGFEFQRHAFFCIVGLESPQQFALIAFARYQDNARITATLGGGRIMQSQSPLGFTGAVTVEAALLQDRCDVPRKSHVGRRRLGRRRHGAPPNQAKEDTGYAKS